MPVFVALFGRENPHPSSGRNALACDFEISIIIESNYLNLEFLCRIPKIWCLFVRMFVRPSYAPIGRVFDHSIVSFEKARKFCV